MNHFTLAIYVSSTPNFTLVSVHLPFLATNTFISLFYPPINFIQCLYGLLPSSPIFPVAFYPKCKSAKLNEDNGKMDSAFSFYLFAKFDSCKAAIRHDNSPHSHRNERQSRKIPSFRRMFILFALASKRRAPVSHSLSISFLFFYSRPETCRYSLKTGQRLRLSLPHSTKPTESNPVQP